MIKKYLSIIILTCVQLYNFSWTQVFTGHLLGGLSSSQISGDGTEGFVQFGVYAGIGTKAEISDIWSLSGSLIFNQKGSRVYKSSNSINTYRLRVNYIETPILLGYAYKKWLIQTGPYLGVKINQREKTEYGITENPRQFKPLDLGLQLQVSYQIKDRLNLTLAFQNSLLPVREHAQEMAYSPSNFVLGEFHQELLDKGQYFTTLMLFVSYRLGE
ncbi:MAG: porin family protein [Brumimicrobium sp.]